MKARTAYTWTSEDPSREFVTHAFNRLRNFIDFEDADDSDLMKPYRRAVMNGSDFSAADVAGTAKMLTVMADRADAAMGGALYNDAPDAALRAAELKAASGNGRTAAVEFVRMFSEALPNPARDLADAWAALEEKGGQ